MEVSQWLTERLTEESKEGEERVKGRHAASGCCVECGGLGPKPWPYYFVRLPRAGHFASLSHSLLICKMGPLIIAVICCTYMLFNPVGKRYDQLCLAENTVAQKTETACPSRAGDQVQAGWPQSGVSDCPTSAPVFLRLRALVLPNGEDQRPSSLSHSGIGGPGRTFRKEPWDRLLGHRGRCPQGAEKPSCHSFIHEERQLLGWRSGV